MNCKDMLISKIEKRTAVVGVVGLGYVGLPLAVEKAKVGFRVIGIEQNFKKVEMINSGRNYIQDVNDDELKNLVDNGLIAAVADFNEASTMDVIVICVPTPLTKELIPELKHVKSVTRCIAHHLRPGQLIALESTTYPGTTEEVIMPILTGSQLQVEKDFFLAHSPERVDPGNKRYTTKNTSKVVGGVGPESQEVALAFYSQTVEQVVSVSSARTAEMAKIFENTFRAVNIALTNEIALLCDHMGLNVWEVLDAAFTKPFGIMPFYPGPGVGGHCIPVDPHYLEWKAKELNFNTHFISLAGEINRKMPEFVRDKALRILGRAGIPSSEARIMIVGISYKKDIRDIRESPAIQIIRLLYQEGVNLLYHDPLVDNFNLHDLFMDSTPLNKDTVSACDLVIITTDHTSLDYQWLVNHASRIFDTRNATRNITTGREKIHLL